MSIENTSSDYDAFLRDRWAKMDAVIATRPRLSDLPFYKRIVIRIVVRCFRWCHTLAITY